MNENRLRSAHSPPADWLGQLLDADVEASDIEAWSVAWSNWTELLEEAEPQSRKRIAEGLPVRAASEPRTSGKPAAESQALRPHYTVALRALVAAVAASLFLACSLSLSPWQQKELFAPAMTRRLDKVAPKAPDGKANDTLAPLENRESSGHVERTAREAPRPPAAWESQEAEVDWRLGRVGQLLETWDHTMQPDDARIFFASQVLSSLAWELDQTGL